MMNIKVNDPQFLLATLKEEVVNRTRYLVSQGIAYDSDWRAAFVELFQVIEQLEIPIGDKLEEYMVEDEPEDTYYTMPDGAQVRQKVPANLVEDWSGTANSSSSKPGEISLKAHEHKLELYYPLGTPVTIGKGKTLWTIDGHHGQTVHVSREGAGQNSKYVTPDKIKFAKNPFQQNDEEV